MVYYHNPNVNEPASYSTSEQVLAYLYTAYPSGHDSLSPAGKVHSFYSRISIECDIIIRLNTDNHRTYILILLEFRDQTFKLASWGLQQIKSLASSNLAIFVLELVQKGIDRMHTIEKNLSSSILSAYISGYKTGYSLQNYKNLCIAQPHYAWVFEEVIANSNTVSSSYFQYIFSKGEVSVMLKLKADGSDLSIPQPKTKLPFLKLSTLEAMQLVMKEYESWHSYITGMANQYPIKETINEKINRCYRTVMLDNLINTL